MSWLDHPVSRRWNPVFRGSAPRWGRHGQVRRIGTGLRHQSLARGCRRGWGPATANRVEAWVVGPGAGTDEAAHQRLTQALESEVLVVVDADGLTLLAAMSRCVTSCRLGERRAESLS